MARYVISYALSSVTRVRIPFDGFESRWVQIPLLTYDCTARGLTGLNRSCRTMARLLTEDGHPIKKSTVQPVLKALRALPAPAPLPAPTVEAVPTPTVVDSDAMPCGCLAVCDGSCMDVDQGPAVDSNHNKSNHNRSRPAKVSRSSTTKVGRKSARGSKPKVGRKPTRVPKKLGRKTARVSKAKVALKPSRARIPRDCKTTVALKRKNRQLAGASSESSSGSSGSDSSDSDSSSSDGSSSDEEYSGAD